VTCRHESLSDKQREELAVKVCAEMALDAELGDTYLGLVDAPDLIMPSISGNVRFFPCYVVHFFNGAGKHNLSRSTPRCDLWDRLADPAHGGASLLPMSKGLRAYVEENYVSRSDAIATFAARMSASSSLSSLFTNIGRY
jgi:hypothetical protein